MRIFKAGILLMGIAGFVIKPIIMLDLYTGGDLIFYMLPPPLQKTFSDSTLAFALRLTSCFLINFAVIIAILMVKKLTEKRKKASSLRWVILVLSMSSIVTSLVVSSVTYIILVFFGAIIAFTYAGKIHTSLTYSPCRQSVATGSCS